MDGHVKEKDRHECDNNDLVKYHTHGKIIKKHENIRNINLRV